MKLPKWATTVTPFSRVLAIVMFAGLPVLAFALGMRYQTLITRPQPAAPAPTEKPLVVPAIGTFTVTGSLQVRTPDSPEDYRYELVLDTPIHDELQSSGIPTVGTVPVGTADRAISDSLGSLVGSRVTAIGTMEWGMSESRYLAIESLAPAPDR